jgi:hypothetical protein
MAGAYEGALSEETERWLMAHGADSPTLVPAIFIAAIELCLPELVERVPREQYLHVVHQARDRALSYMKHL